MLSTFETDSRSAPPADPYQFEEDANVADAGGSDDQRRIDYLPSPAEIAAASAAIRSEWTHSEKRRRFVGELPAEELPEGVWAPPVIDTTHLRQTMISGGASI